MGEETNNTETDALGFSIHTKKRRHESGLADVSGIDPDSDYYNMNHCKRGTAIIFNHLHFDSNLSKRRGTVKDGKDLEEILKNVQFDVMVYNDLKYGAICDVISNLSKADHTDSDCLLVAVMSHGDTGRIHAFDQHYPPDFLWKSFSGDKCPSLAGKPKLFFIQACRGDEVDDGARVRAVTQTDGKSPSYVIPVMADILVMYSSYDGYYSWRIPDTGSWFIQSLCDEFKLRVKTTDLLTLLTFVNRRMAITYKSIVPSDPKMHEKKQIGTIVSTLTRLLYFYPPAK